MKLKPVKRPELKKKVEFDKPKEEPRKTGGKKANKLPPDGYQPMFPPIRFLVREYPTFKDPTKFNKDYLEISVKRFDDDEAPACVFIQMYRESETYTGYLRGKCNHFPLEALYEVIEKLQEISDECDKRHIEY